MKRWKRVVWSFYWVFLQFSQYTGLFAVTLAIIAIIHLFCWYVVLWIQSRIDVLCYFTQWEELRSASGNYTCLYNILSETLFSESRDWPADSWPEIHDDRHHPPNANWGTWYYRALVPIRDVWMSMVKEHFVVCLWVLQLLQAGSILPRASIHVCTTSNWNDWVTWPATCMVRPNDNFLHSVHCWRSGVNIWGLYLTAGKSSLSKVVAHAVPGATSSRYGVPLTWMLCSEHMIMARFLSAELLYL
jgi:hypothetical protein